MTFWKHKKMEEMSPEEWESLCDGCGKCCLHSFRDPTTDERLRVAVSCELLDIDSCRCTDYPNRMRKVPGCLKMTPEVARTADWLPRSCAYRLIATGEPLQWWHPLVSGDPETVHDAGVSVRGRVFAGEGWDEDDLLDAPPFYDAFEEE